MFLSASHKSSRLPKRFPVGTTYVIEGRGGEHGHLLVSSRYVVLPGGQRINVAVPTRARGRSMRTGGNSHHGKAR